ncbi:MAG: 2OG-Fe dioxygenase family protein [Terriglobales bacterium]
MTAAANITPTRNSDDEHIWECLLDCGYALVPDRRIGFGAEFREHVIQTYFTESILRHDIHDVLDRERVRDVMRYERSGDSLRLTEHETIMVKDREDHLLDREYARVELLHDARMVEWIGVALSLVPPAQRNSRGTFSANLLRTHTAVVPGGPHQDGKEFVLIYVLDKLGGGAETQLYRIDSPGDAAFSEILRPGDMIVFRDELFRHGTTPLIAPPGGTAHRDAMVCTVNYPDEYSVVDG